MNVPISPNTPQQQAIIDATLSGHSVIVTARAGCAKTSTLERVAHSLPSNQHWLALAFNVAIKQELEARLPSNVTCLTLNGLGHRAWAASRRRLTIDKEKPYKVIDDYLKSNSLTASFEEKRQLTSLLNGARTLGLCPSGLPGVGFLDDSPESWDRVVEWAEAYFDSERQRDEQLKIARGVLRHSIQWGFNSLLDFIDQIYLPTTFGGAFPRHYHGVMGDEVQDWSGANHKMVAACTSKQKLLVGDPKQAIYAFRGAMSDSMEHLEKTMPPGTEWKHLKLTKTFRCGKAIVARQRSYVPDFEAADQNSPGQVEAWPRALKHNTGLDEATWSPKNVPDGSAILCRNNAPLISCALKFLAARRRVTILGRDFAQKLQRDISKATGGAPGSLPIDEVLGKVKAFYLSKLEGGPRKPTASQLAQAQDRVAAIVAISETCQRLSDLSDTIASIFSDKIAPVTFATGHKAKGLEWDFVLHLNPFLIPGKWAQEDPEALEQEYNLKYVIETRPRHTLVLANLDDLDI